MYSLYKNIKAGCKSLLFISLVAYISFFVTRIYFKPDIPHKTIMSVIDSSVHYKVNFSKDGLDYYATCTGVVLDNTPDFALVATAKHCIKEGSPSYVEGILVEKVIVHDTRDLALVILSEKIPHKYPAKRPSEEHTVFSNIFHIGFPGGVTLYSQGKTLAQSFKIDVGLLHVIKGCSGGGVFNQEGELIGIAVMTAPPLGLYESYRGFISFLAAQDIDSLKLEIKSNKYMSRIK